MILDEQSARADLAELVADLEDPDLARFVEAYYRGVPDAYLAGSRADDLLGACVSHRELLARRLPGEPVVRVFNPTYEIDGWSSARSVVHTVTTDSAFIVDSVSLAVELAGYSLHRMIHPVVPAGGDIGGGVADPDIEGPAVSLVSIEFDRIVDPEKLEALSRTLELTLRDVSVVVVDWSSMVAVTRDVAETLNAAGDERSSEAAALLDWLIDDNFIFLGYRRYELLYGDSPEDLALRSIPGTGLGILAQAPGTGATMVRFADMPPEIGARATTLDPIHITKTNGRSTVHRNVRMDYVGVKIIEAGRVVGEHRILGLFTAASYRHPFDQVPILRRLVAHTLAASGTTTDSHSANELLAAIDLYPRDDLFQLDAAELLEITSAIVGLGRRRDVAVFARPEPFGRFVSCLVLLPRDQLTTTLRHKIEMILMEAFQGTDIEYTTQVTASAHAQLHYVISHRQGQGQPDMASLHAAIARVAHRWTDDLRELLRETFGDAEGGRLHQQYGNAFGPAYVDQYSVRAAVSDITRFEQEHPDGDIGIELCRPLGAPPGRLQLKIHRADHEIRLSEVLPVLQNLGADVLEEQPHTIALGDGRTIFLYDFGLEVSSEHTAEMDGLKARFEQSFLQAWHGLIENDGFNRLVVVGGLAWPEVRLVRAYAAYLRQVGARFSAAYVADTLVNHSHVTRSLVELFRCRFDPQLGPDERQEAAEAVVKQLDYAIEDVVELDEDRILRAGRQLIMATTRTNYFQLEANGQPKGYVTLKFNPSRVPDLAPPLPRYETFVFSARTEGIHLRAGDVSRGGIRWSTRLEDYRTEVLGLMTTQVAKNSVIVPTGAKGGFIAKRLTPSSDRPTVAAEVEACYRLFISGLLDVTDNLVDSRAVPPPAVVSYDSDGSYLVVAADKGTATFSDVANSIAKAYGFWLGDAFASGGSAGYDHKAMGITARGAWESVARHFRALGVNVAEDRFTVVGIGDMSGDVFGNGMLLSRTIALVGAFDHRHVMIDPDPDLESGWRERKRLFDQPGSSWADYDPALLSPGGAVFSRAAKSIEPSLEIRRLLDMPADVVSITPNELIRRLLRCRVDLLWNGGIGTFVKASSESHLDASDKVNDGIRVDAGELGCRVIGEGGNLGLTPLARIELALAGCRLMSDAIDNSAGVATSDIEVNIKILLDGVVANGDLTTKQRDQFLEAMTAEVAQLVLSINYAQGRAVENELAEGHQLLDVHERLIGELVRGGQLDRSVEPMPDAEALADRHNRGIGLTAPEMSAVLAYTKNALKAELVGAAAPGPDRFMDEVLLAYFPSPLRSRFAAEIAGHPLRQELLATIVANRVIDRGGVSLVMRLADETGAAWVDVARAHTAAWELFSMSGVWDEVAALDGQVTSEVQTKLLLRGRRLVERSTRWLLRQRRHPIDVTAVLVDFADRLDDACQLIDREASEAQREAVEAAVAELVLAGVGADLARRSVSHDHMARTLDIIETSRTLNYPLADAASAWFRLESRLGLAWLNEAIVALPRAQRWQSLARSALRDELSHTHAELTATVLGHVAAAAGPGPAGLVDNGAVDGWLGLNAHAVGRVDDLREAIIAEPHPGVEPLTVILRELRSLAGG